MGIWFGKHGSEFNAFGSEFGVPLAEKFDEVKGNDIFPPG